jgi:hypothetical protein
MEILSIGETVVPAAYLGHPASFLGGAVFQVLTERWRLFLREIIVAFPS